MASTRLFFARTQSIQCTTDEDGSEVYTFMDKAGRQLLVRRTVFYYDYYKRIIQRRSLDSSGMLCVADSKYDFAGSSLRRRETVRPTSSSPADTLDVRHRYDHRGRLLHTETLLNGRDTVPVWHEYDAVGRLAATTLGEGAGAPRTDYRYNLRGWLVRLQGREFTESLTYENPALPETVPSYSGNISECHWRYGTGGSMMGYSFAYDGLSRLTSSSLFENGRQTDRFVERGISYDRNGNIKTLVRTADGTTCDSLTYYYSGNRLHSFEYAPIFDIEEVHPGGSIEFPPVEVTDPDDLKDIQPLPFSYFYDPNGNMTRDYKHGLDLAYNRLNLVEKVTREGTTLANYSYLSDGTKLSATDGAGDGLVYAGSLVYRKRNGVLSLESAAFNGGRFVATNNGMEARYFFTDHLGSVRAVVNSAGEVLERNDYYPYGMRWEDPESQISDNRHRFNGKEEQAFVNLPYIDYGARQYDPSIGIWRGLDPLASIYGSYSPYAFCLNNPLKYMDKAGRNPIIVIGGVALTLADILLIGTGAVASGVILQKSAETGEWGLAPWLNHYSPGWEHQQNEDRKRKEAFNRAQANVQKSINDNFPDPDDYDPNKAPKIRRGGKYGTTAFAFLELIHTLGTDSNNRLMIKMLWHYLFGDDPKDTENENDNSSDKREIDRQDENGDTKQTEAGSSITMNSYQHLSYTEYLKRYFGTENSNH